MSHLANKVRACFAVAASSTFESERQAAVSRGLTLIEKGGLNPDDFDIPGRAMRSREPENSAAPGLFADIFGSCINCGAVVGNFALCRGCALNAEAQGCHHGIHGSCMECNVEWALASA